MIKTYRIFADIDITWPSLKPTQDHFFELQKSIVGVGQFPNIGFKICRVKSINKINLRWTKLQNCIKVLKVYMFFFKSWCKAKIFFIFTAKPLHSRNQIFVKLNRFCKAMVRFKKAVVSWRLAQGDKSLTARVALSFFRQMRFCHWSYQ